MNNDSLPICDSRGRLISETTPVGAGERWLYEFDALDNLLAVTGPDGVRNLVAAGAAPDGIDPADLPVPKIVYGKDVKPALREDASRGESGAAGQGAG